MPDAPAPPPDAPDVPHDAGVADATAPDAKKDASSSHQAHPEAARGALFVTGMPILTVTVDGTKYHDSPVTIPLKAGPHKLLLTNENGYRELVPITIEPNQTTTIERNK